MKTMKNFLSMAALALMGAMMTGCSSDDNFDNPQQPENKSKVVTLTTTVGFDASAGTRALTSTGVKTFAVGDQIAVIYKNTSDQTVTATSTALTTGDITNEGKNANFTVTLTNPKASEAVRYIYPAAMLAATVATNAGQCRRQREIRSPRHAGRHADQSRQQARPRHLRRFADLRGSPARIGLA